MKERGLSQAELARRVGVKQPTIHRLVHGEHYGSTRIHLIARELGTTPAYLSGETDDPSAELPAPSVLSREEEEWVALFRQLDEHHRAALFTLARATLREQPTPAPTVHAPSLAYSAEERAPLA